MHKLLSKEFLPYADLRSEEPVLQAIIGSGVVVDCIPSEEWKAMDMPEEDLIRESILGDTSDGRYIYPIERARLFKHPIKIKGALNFWTVDLSEELEKQFSKNFQRV